MASTRRCGRASPRGVKSASPPCTRRAKRSRSKTGSHWPSLALWFTGWRKTFNLTTKTRRKPKASKKCTEQARECLIDVRPRLGRTRHCRRRRDGSDLAPLSVLLFFVSSCLRGEHVFIQAETAC